MTLNDLVWQKCTLAKKINRFTQPNMQKNLTEGRPILSAAKYKLTILAFTARCYAERGYEIACRPSVCPSVTLMYRDHIGWNGVRST